MLKPIPITHTIIKTKAYELSFFAYAPSVTEATSKYIVTTGPVLYLQKVIGTYSEYNPEQFKTMRFKITHRNIFRVVKFLNEIVSWFYDKDKKDLFLLTDSGQLIFNGDYSKLSTVTEKSYFDTDRMKAIPDVITPPAGNPTEGAHLYINRQENMIDLTLYEIEELLGVLASFNFHAELLLMLESIRYVHAINGGTIPPFQPQQRYSSSASPSGFANL